MGQHVIGVNVNVIDDQGKLQSVAQGISGDDEGETVSLRLPDNPRPGLILGRSYVIDFGSGDVRSMTCTNAGGADGNATFRLL